MSVTIGGWWRLWIVLTIVHGCAVLVYAWRTWPALSTVPPSSALLREMSPEARDVLLLTSPTPSELETLLDQAESVGASGTAERLRSQIHDLTTGSWRTAPILITAPNEQRWEVPYYVTQDQITLVIDDYSRVLRSHIAPARTAATRRAMFIFILPCALLLALGAAGTWVIRGFRRCDAAVP